jgi:hypothetical protein
MISLVPKQTKINALIILPWKILLLSCILFRNLTIQIYRTNYDLIYQAVCSHHTVLIIFGPKTKMQKITL